MPPPKSNFDLLADVMKKRMGLDLDVSSSKALAASLDRAVVRDLCAIAAVARAYPCSQDPSRPELNTLIRIMATRCMLAAEYFNSGSVSRDTFGHYGLACPLYLHFTSPIRRYADVIAHRQLAAAIGYAPLHPSLQSKSHIERVLHNVNKRHRLAQMAGRASVEYYVGLAIAERNKREGIPEGRGIEAEAFVIRVFRNGLSIYVPTFGLEGLITFGKDSHTFEPEDYKVVVPSGKKKVAISIFDTIRVEISTEKDKHTQRGKVKMAMVSPARSEML